MKAVGIETQSIEVETQSQQLIAPGTTVVPPQQLRVAATPAAGLIETFYVAPDEDIKENDPIASLRSPDLVEAQRAFLTAVSEANVAGEKLKRDEYLLRQGVVVDARLLVSRAEAAQAQAALNEREQILLLHGMTKNEIDKLRENRKIASSLVIRAPTSGSVIARQASPGERVAASAPLVTIAKLSPIWVNIQVPVEHMGDLVNVSKVVLPAFGIEGKLVRIGKTIDPTTQSVIAVAEFQTDKPTPKPGQAVQATLAIRSANQRLWRAPARSIGHYDGREWLFVQDAEGFHAVPVRIESETADFSTLEAPFKGDERIAVRGMIALLSRLASRTP